MPITEPAQSPLRWAVLLFSCLCLIGNYYCYDNPAALKTQLEEGPLQGDEFMYNLLYSVYSFPNMVIPFIGGWMCDRFGASRCLLLFASFLAAGQSLFAFGATINSVPLLLVGRVVFGFGGENLTVANSCLVANWFRGKEMAFAMGLSLSISRLGSVVNNFVSPTVANHTSVATALWVGAIFCGAGVALTCALFPIERTVAAAVAAGRKEAKADAGAEPPASPATPATPAAPAAPSAPDGMSAPLIGDDAAAGMGGGGLLGPLATMARFKASFWMLTVSCLAVYGCVLPFNNVASSLLMERTYFRPSPAGCALTDPFECQSAANPPSAGSGCVAAHGGARYAPPLPGNATVGGTRYAPLRASDVDCTQAAWKGKGACTHDFCSAQTAAEGKATKIMSIPYLISGVASPFLGYAIDRFGGRALLAAACPVVLIAVHLLLGFTGITPALPLVGQGVAYSIYAATLWPSVPFTVPAGAEGLAYGFITAVQNGGLGAFPLYIPWVEMLFVGFAAVGLAAGVLLNVYDAARGHVLNRVHLHAAATHAADAAKPEPMAPADAAPDGLAPLTAASAQPDPAV